jgi:sugar-specific transcriptional regulator TrmB
MREDLVRKLSDFGFTVNQAKVYLSIVQSGTTCVRMISEYTQLHRQDIYKILPKLEKMGLITKTIDVPLIIEAIPAEKALSTLVSTEREKANERISRLEANLKELINALREKQVEPAGEQVETRFSLLTTDAQIKNMADLSFENARIGCDAVMSLELITRRMDLFRERFQTLAKNKARTRLIIETLNNEDLVKRTLEEIRPNMGDFAAKLIYKNRSLPYQIIDHKEVWISRKKETESGFSCVLWTNGKNIVQFREENFEKAWNNHQAITIYPPKKKRIAKREYAKVQLRHEPFLPSPTIRLMRPKYRRIAKLKIRIGKHNASDFRAY